jgi:hypothetical protein
MVKVFNQGARLYICGGAMVGEGFAATAKEIYLEAAEELGKDMTDEAVDEWFQRIWNDSVCIRYFCLRGQICNKIVLHYDIFLKINDNEQLSEHGIPVYYEAAISGSIYE